MGRCKCARCRAGVPFREPEQLQGMAAGRRHVDRQLEPAVTQPKIRPPSVLTPFLTRDHPTLQHGVNILCWGLAMRKDKRETKNDKQTRIREIKPSWQ